MPSPAPDEQVWWTGLKWILAGVETRRRSMARQSMIDKGIIEPVARGQLRSTMPGFASFVEAQFNLTDTDSGTDTIGIGSPRPRALPSSPGPPRRGRAR